MATTFCQIYCSSPNTENVQDDLSSILMKSQHNNKRMDITGILLFSQDYFVQLLEGEKHEIFRLYETIMKDPRHSNPTILFQNYTDQRLLPHWSLALAPLKAIPELNIAELAKQRQLMSLYQVELLINYAKELI